MAQTVFDRGLPANAISLDSGIVVYGVIVKRPYVSDQDSPREYEYRCQIVEHEKDIYRRLDQSPSSDPPISATRVVKQMAAALSRIHDRRVLVVDLESGNILMHPNGSLVFSDFGTSSLLSLDSDVWTAEDFAGFSFETDICSLGAVIYEVVTGKYLADFDAIAHEVGGWPPRAQLPSTANVWLGSIIDACWTQGTFRTTDQLCQLLDEETAASDYADGDDVNQHPTNPSRTAGLARSLAAWSESFLVVPVYPVQVAIGDGVDGRDDFDSHLAPWAARGLEKLWEACRSAAENHTTTAGTTEAQWKGSRENKQRQRSWAAGCSIRYSLVRPRSHPLRLPVGYISNTISNYGPKEFVGQVGNIAGIVIDDYLTLRLDWKGQCGWEALRLFSQGIPNNNNG